MNDKPRGRPPWELEQREESFVIIDADRRPLYSTFFYKGKKPPVPNPLDRMSWDEALRLARALLELPELRKRKRAPGGVPAEVQRANMQNAWAALRMIREALESLGPPGTLPSEEAVLQLHGPEPVHEATAIVDALQKLLARA